ncbi:hypothetical protein OBG91_08050 [Lactococcus lactis]|nr:hypothetical protein [Lactococcus lactis]
MKNNEEPRMKWSDDEYEAMIDLATRQLAERMAERALMTYEIYKYDYLDSQFVADFIAEFVISAYRSYLIKPENLDEEVMLLLFVNMAYENMRGLPDEVAQYHRLLDNFVTFIMNKVVYVMLWLMKQIIRKWFWQF